MKLPQQVRIRSIKTIEMELNFDTFGNYLQEYINKGLQEDLKAVTAAQRLGFIEKYLEFIEPKQLRRGTKLASGDKEFVLVEVK